MFFLGAIPNAKTILNNGRLDVLLKGILCHVNCVLIRGRICHAARQSSMYKLQCNA